MIAHLQSITEFLEITASSWKVIFWMNFRDCLQCVFCDWFHCILSALYGLRPGGYRTFPTKKPAVCITDNESLLFHVLEARVMSYPFH